MIEQTLFDVIPRAKDPNPMVMAHGVLEGKTCKDCIHLCYHEFSKRYYKCDLRGCSNSMTTDHRVRWNACKLYKQNQTL
jgi:hypothetical protein